MMIGLYRGAGTSFSYRRDGKALVQMERQFDLRSARQLNPDTLVTPTFRSLRPTLRTVDISQPARRAVMAHEGECSGTKIDFDIATRGDKTEACGVYRQEKERGQGLYRRMRLRRDPL
jgi:hypothetical protein